MTHFFVTNAGLAAALKDPAVNDALVEILRGSASKHVIEQHRQQGHIDVNRRPAPVDNNAVLLGGIVSRLREAINGNGLNADHAPGDDTDPAISDLRRGPKKLYRLKGNKAALTDDQLRALSSGARRVYTALRRMEVGTTKSLADATGFNVRTIENALGTLRKTGVLTTIDYSNR
jgi:hypothetical protein